MGFSRHLLSAFLVCLPTAVAAGADPSPEHEFFESRVRPVLAEHCFSCHGPQKQKSGLRLDSREAILKGADGGQVVVPHEPNKSRLIDAVKYQGELKMPPDKKLADDQIELLVQWIQIGLPWPTSTDVSVSTTEVERARNAHWAFRPVSCSNPPVVKETGWASGPVDLFIQAKIEEKNLKPSPRADRRTLIRRATFDLIGLPPKPEEVDAFERDESSDAFAKLIDRLLAAPQYGERWGRYWLDVARYADSKGYVFNNERRFPYSYTYRDYVIRAFNEDLPYDQFVMQQVAADQLPLNDDKRPLAAMGFLTLGRRFNNNIHDIIDDRIDVVTRGLMGLTVTCARCHDHKYDPIPTADYYSLYGVFANSVEPVEKPLIGMAKDTESFRAFDKELKAKKKVFDDFRQEKHASAKEELRSKVEAYLLRLLDPTPIPTEGSMIVGAGDLRPQMLARWRDYLERAAHEHNPVFAPWHALVALPAENFKTEAAKRLAAFSDSADAPERVNPLILRALRNEPPASMQDVAHVYGRLFGEIQNKWLTVWRPSTQPSSSRPAESLPDKDEEELRQVLYSPKSPTAISLDELVRYLEQPLRAKLRELRNEYEKFEYSSPDAPPRAHTLVDSDPLQDARIFIRGNPAAIGRAVPRQFLEVLSGKERKPFEKGSGRLELAQAIANRDNPLTARVLVNRVWMHHFGAGLVRTPGDFGARGEPPTHPELLDYLACRFMQEGWSIKKLHRMMMLTSVYQQSSDDNPRYQTIDPENRWLWHMNRRRLDFESMRDSLLAVAGQLDMTAGGPSVELMEPISHRRSVYGMIERQNLPAFFRMFDFANPDATNPQRHTTTVPQQALFLMNSPFIIEQARSFTSRPEVSQQSATEQRVRQMYRLALNRDPQEHEVQLATQFIEKPESPVESITTKTSNWKNGYGRYDRKLQRVTSFTPFAHWSGDSWRVGVAFPDPKLGYLYLNGTSGHVGNGEEYETIRRWSSPQNGVISIDARLEHTAAMDCGDGVRSWIVSSRLGEVGSWIAHNSKVDTPVRHMPVQAGDTIDFVVNCRENVFCDTFIWSPVIRLTFASTETTAEVVKVDFQPGQKVGELRTEEWNAKDDFSGPPPLPLDAWGRYAQVLLLTNEFLFVD